MQIWDTAGQERYRTITNSYYKGADGVVIVFDLTAKDSFQNVEYWRKEIENYAGPDVSVLVLGNKVDLP